MRIALACLLASLAPAVLAEGCHSDETQIGEDDDYYYCMKTAEINACRSKGGNSANCIHAGCVRTAGVNLRKEINECKSKNETCLYERNAPSSLVESISGCIVGTAVTGNLGGCFVGTASGAVKWDTAVALCKAKFGDCVEPGLKEHKSFVAACDRYKGR